MDGIFKPLADCSKFMEGQHYVVSSSYWPALRRVESILSPQPADSPVVAGLRQVMLTDHNTKRVTLEKSLKNPLHVLMHLTDPRSACFHRGFS